MELTAACEQAMDREQLVQDWRVSQLTRLGIPVPLAEVYADRVDWHQIARLVRRGFPPRLAMRIARAQPGNTPVVMPGPASAPAQGPARGASHWRMRPRRRLPHHGTNPSGRQPAGATRSRAGQRGAARQTEHRKDASK